MQLQEMLTHSALIIFIFVNAVFILAWILRDNGIMDIAWGIGFLLISWYALIQNQPTGLRQWIITILVTAWGLRLSGHIFIRNLGRGEDFRYNNWREQWGKFALVRSYFQVYLLQGALILVFSAPVWIIHLHSESGLVFWDYLGMAVWLTGWLIESIADFQLLRFKKYRDNAGEIMQTGLWKYSRHPNYFGESVTWWGLAIMALPVQYGWITLLSPALLTFFLLRVSGVSMLEKKYDHNTAYQQYAERTSAFIPLPPKNRS